MALGIAFVLGLRHASDPDHLVALTSLLAVGLPLIAFKSRLPGWVERGAETGVGLVILALAARVIVKWLRGDYRAGPHVHEHHHHHDHRCLRRGPGAAHGHRDLRTPRQAFGIGMLHGLAGTTRSSSC